MSDISIFISYSHDSDDHREQVLGLSERLRSDSVVTILDRYVERGSPPEGWPRWMMNGLDDATHIMCVCTETYYRRFRGQEVANTGKGVDWEGALITQELYDARSSTHKFIPIIFDSASTDYVPEPLRSQTYYLLDSEANYKALYDALLNQSGIEPGPIGPPQTRQRERGQATNFDQQNIDHPTPATTDRPNTDLPWYSLVLKRQNNTLLAEDDDGKKTELLVSDLTDPNSPDQMLEELATWLFNNQTMHAHIPSRLRIMTDDPELAILPWHQLPDPASGLALMNSGWVIETGPVQGRSYKRDFIPISLHTPLLTVPAEHNHEIAGDNHYAVVQNYFEAYLDIHGPIPRVKHPQHLQRELDLHKPDLLYLCARFDGQHIILDQGRNGEDRFSLQTLGEWIEQADIRPVVILSLIGATLTLYPQVLVDNTKLLWIQSTSRNKRYDDLQQNLARVMQLSIKNGDLAALILQQNSHMNQGMQSLLWLNGVTPRLDVKSATQKQAQQIRAALLKVMLGRTALKDQMAGGISRYLNQQVPIISYAVSGHRSACPHDVPEQIKQRLQWDNIQNSLPVIAYYFHINLADDSDIYNTLDLAISDGILCGSDDAEQIIRRQLENRGLTNQPCCISLNWLFQVDTEAEQNIATWLEEWGLLVSEYFSSVNLEKVTLVNAVCLQVDDETNPQTLQNEANRVLRKLRNQQGCGIQSMIYKDALGRLDADEIEDFLENDQRYWQQELKLEQHSQPDKTSMHYATWLIDKTDGQFEAVVQLIWRQYQCDYQDYLQ